MHLLWDHEYKFFKKKKLECLDSLQASEGVLPAIKESINSAVYVG